MTNPTIMGKLEVKDNETEIDCQNIKNEIMEIMKGSRDKKWLDQVILDFTTDFDIEWVLHDDNQKPDPFVANDNDEPDTIRLASQKKFITLNYFILPID